MPHYFINERLIPIARQSNLLIVHPHAQRTGGGTFRNRVLVDVFGKEKVYARMFLPGAQRWSRLRESDLAGYRAYTDLHNFTNIGLKRPFLGIALLRDPVYRAVSLYRYVKRIPDHRHYALAMQYRLEEFYRRAAARDTTYFRNVQCRRICGYGSARRALEFIRAYYIGVGFTESLNEFVSALCPVLGWPQIALDSRGPDRARYESDVTPRFRALVLADNREDQLLFEIMSAGSPIVPARTALGEMRTAATELRDLLLAGFWRATRR